jgi:hypothetical protein
MSNVLQNMPDHIVGFGMLGFGAFVLLESWGIIQAGLLIQIGACVAIWYGFMLLHGPKHLKAFLERLQGPRRG